MRHIILLGALLGLIISCARADDCTGYDIGDCETHEGCTACKMDVIWAKISFCVSEDIAEKLPQQMFTCGDDTPEPVIDLKSALHSDECSDLDKEHCASASACSWCVSAAVPSACYTVEQAKRLPAAVFSCDLPHAVV